MKAARRGLAAHTLHAALLAAPLGAFAQPTPGSPTTPATLAHCAQIGASADRLICYDKLAGRAAEPAPAPPGAPPSAAPTTELAPVDTSRKEGPARGDSGSLMSKYWELEPGDKRGIFNFTGYKPNYVLPLHFTTRINRSPQSPTQAAVALPDYRHVEAKIQLSLRTKLFQDLVLPGADLWVAYSQVSLWQLYNGVDSKPFRNTDYQPEMMYIVPVPEGLRRLPFGWQWRYGELALTHQSNGQSDPLSRSWNRVTFGAGFERGDMSFTMRFLRRLHENPETDNNPDLTDYVGRGEFQLAWTPGAATASLLYRNSLKSQARGSLQFEWTYPVRRDQPNGLRWYVQAFTGYGETLTDYNFRQTSVGAGLTFLQF